MGWLNPKGAEKVLTLYKILAELFTLNTVRVLEQFTNEMS